jgi:glycine/D-amino acid oxidase-like deaminating enzyme
MAKRFIIIGAGSFGLQTALHLRKMHKDASIIIFDINKSLSASVNGGNGIIDYEKDSRLKNIPFKEIKQMIDMDFSKMSNNIEFYIFHLFNQIFNNKINRKLIKNITVEDDEEIECDTSDYYPHNYWEKLTNRLIAQNVEIKDMTEIINYISRDGEIIIKTKNKKEYACDKLILCTAGNLNLVKNNYYHKFIEVFSGYGAIIEVKNQPKCFYYKDGVFVTPDDTNKNLVKITFKVELGSNNGNYNMDKGDKNYEKVEEYIRNNKEIENLGLIEIKNIWRGSRAMTYDTIPFINQVDQNVYLLTGGSYIGTHMASNFGKWMVELIMNKPFSNLPMIDNIPFDPTIKRLEMIRKKYYFILVAILILIILVIIRIKNNIKKLFI